MLERYDDVMSVEDLCELLRVGRNLVYELLQSGELKGFRLGRVRKIPKSSVETFLTSQHEQ